MLECIVILQNTRWTKEFCKPST